MCVCVYLPYEKGNDNVDEYLYQLSVIDNVITQFTDSVSYTHLTLPTTPYV